MNKTISALIIKLQWQLRDLKKQLKLNEQNLENFNQQLEEIRQKISQASKTPAYIIPEREIAGLYFIMAQQQLEDQLQANKTEQLAMQTHLLQKKQRLEIELKMLEKYQIKQQDIIRQKKLLNEQKNSDELVIQRNF